MPDSINKFTITFYSIKTTILTQLRQQVYRLPVFLNYYYDQLVHRSVYT